MANHVDIDYKLLEGVHMLEESSYRKHARKLSVLTCETCYKKHGEDGVDVKRCTGVRRLFYLLCAAISFIELQCLGVGFCSKEVGTSPAYSVNLHDSHKGPP